MIAKEDKTNSDSRNGKNESKNKEPAGKNVKNGKEIKNDVKKIEPKKAINSISKETTAVEKNKPPKKEVLNLHDGVVSAVKTSLELPKRN